MYFSYYLKLGRCEASWGEPERDMTVSTRLSDSVFTETHGLENALKSEYESKRVHMSIRQMSCQRGHSKM